MSRVNPYSALKRRFTDFCNDCFIRRTAPLTLYPKSRLHEGWRLDGIYERVVAANDLGYDVQLKATAEGLEMIYIQKLPKRPYQV